MPLLPPNRPGMIRADIRFPHTDEFLQNGYWPFWNYGTVLLFAPATHAPRMEGWWDEKNRHFRLQFRATNPDKGSVGMLVAAGEPEEALLFAAACPLPPIRHKFDGTTLEYSGVCIPEPDGIRKLLVPTGDDCIGVSVKTDAQKFDLAWKRPIDFHTAIMRMSNKLCPFSAITISLRGAP